MDSWEKTGLTERRRLLLEEIQGFRYAMRSHCLIARGQLVRTKNNAVATTRALHLAPAAASFVAGLLRGKQKARHPENKGKWRGLLSTAFAAFAVLKVLRS